MPDREAADHRLAGQFCIVVENLICRKLPVFGTWAVEVAECDSRNSLEKAVLPELLHQAVDAVRVFACIFENKNVALAIQFIRSSAKRDDNGQISSDQATASFPRHDSLERCTLRHADFPGGQTSRQPVFKIVEREGCKVFSFEIAEHGAVDGDEMALFAEGCMERCHVGKTHEKLWMFFNHGIIEKREKTSRAIAAPEADDGFHGVVFEEVMQGKDPKKVIEEKGMKQVSDDGAILAIVNSVLDANPQSIEDFKNGKDRAVGFLVGQVMKASRGQANPKRTNELIQEELKKR